MGLYDTHVLPHVIDLACGTDDVAERRRAVVPRATGRVLEVGMGPAHNLPFYDSERVELIWGLEPSDGMRRKAAPRIEASDLDVRWIDLPGEEIPLEDESVDTVVLTYTLCSIADSERALQQMRRVLRPDGRLLFVEHGESPDATVRRWQHRIDPIWTRVAGGCRITRPVTELIEAAGFVVVDLTTGYTSGPRIASWISSGSARIA
jgi:ubiquinone/menaquinone biosynthesis C-methylase UbiE